MIEVQTRGDPESRCVGFARARGPSKNWPGTNTRSVIRRWPRATWTQSQSLPDRDAQFRHIGATVRRCLSEGSGHFRGYQEERTHIRQRGPNGFPPRQPIKVQGHDFPTPEHLTAFMTLDRLCQCRHRITTRERLRSPPFADGGASLSASSDADGGGSNGFAFGNLSCRSADETGLPASVCHFPPGANGTRTPPLFFQDTSAARTSKFGTNWSAIWVVLAITARRASTSISPATRVNCRMSWGLGSVVQPRMKMAAQRDLSRPSATVLGVIAEPTKFSGGTSSYSNM